jgi:phosphonate transport system substrate-binding protein
MIRLLKLLLLAVATAWLPAYAQNTNELNFGIISTESSTNLKENWQPLIDDMQKRTGLKVNAFFASDYAGIIEAMRFNKVQVAWFGNKSAMEAVDRSNGEVFAQMIAPDGGQGYYSLLVVHKDSPLRSLEDVLKNGKNLNFGNGDPNSTSGFLVPSYYVFALNKIDPKTHFKTARGASHETNLLAVVNKQVDVATNNTENMERFISKFPDKAKDVRVIWKSPLIPNDPLVWRKDLAPDTKKKVRDFFLAYGNDSGPDAAREKAIVLKLTTAGFKASDDRQLIPIRQLELFKDKTKIENDTAMSAADKTAKLEEINRKLAQLNTQLAAKR